MSRWYRCAVSGLPLPPGTPVYCLFLSRHGNWWYPTTSLLHSGVIAPSGQMIGERPPSWSITQPAYIHSQVMRLLTPEDSTLAAYGSRIREEVKARWNRGDGDPERFCLYLQEHKLWRGQSDAHIELLSTLLGQPDAPDSVFLEWARLGRFLIELADTAGRTLSPSIQTTAQTPQDAWFTRLAELASGAE